MLGGLMINGTVVDGADTPVNLLRTLLSAPALSPLDFELRLRVTDFAAAAPTAPCRTADVSVWVFLALPNVDLVALITVLRIDELGANVRELSEGVILNLYGAPSRSGRVTLMTTFFSLGISMTVFCSASVSSVTASRIFLVRGWSTVDGGAIFGCGGTGRGLFRGAAVVVERVMAAKLRVDVEASTLPRLNALEVVLEAGIRLLLCEVVKRLLLCELGRPGGATRRAA